MLTEELVDQAPADYARIEQAILFLEQNFQSQPTLKEIADHVGLSEYHFQRLFSRWAGISPKRFLQFLTLQYAKELLGESQSLLDTTYEAGLSSPGRLHDLFITHEAVTPGEFKQQGDGLTIAYGFHGTPFGEALLALTERGICGLSFVQPGKRDEALEELKGNWPRAHLYEDPAATQPLIDQIFTPDSSQKERRPLHLYLKGTNFQVRVWQALLRIPPGAVVSYDTVAALIGQPSATRAVGGATGRNPIAYLIPCHRVIRKVGAVDNYRWGSTRKKAILAWEASQRARQSPISNPQSPISNL
jgi:AraC family transcriptional regulator of adaptative response/methylated-DNA-[protein]-cysteine methyltransferase